MQQHESEVKRLQTQHSSALRELEGKVGVGVLWQQATAQSRVQAQPASAAGITPAILWLCSQDVQCTSMLVRRARVGALQAKAAAEAAACKAAAAATDESIQQLTVQLGAAAAELSKVQEEGR
jgi:hypothetical protein